MDDRDPGRSTGLPPEELQRIEDALYRAVLARVLRGVAVGTLIALGSLALVGWLSWSMVKRRLVTDAVSALQTDGTIRSGLLPGLEIDSATFARLLDSLEVMTLANTGAGGAAGSDAELRRLIDQLVAGQAVSPQPGEPPRRSTSPRH